MQCDTVWIVTISTIELTPEQEVWCLTYDHCSTDSIFSSLVHKFVQYTTSSQSQLTKYGCYLVEDCQITCTSETQRFTMWFSFKLLCLSSSIIELVIFDILLNTLMIAVPPSQNAKFMQSAVADRVALWHSPHIPALWIDRTYQ